MVLGEVEYPIPAPFTIFTPVTMKSWLTSAVEIVPAREICSVSAYVAEVYRHSTTRDAESLARPKTL